MKKHLASIITISRVFVAFYFYLLVAVFGTSNVVLLFVCFALIELSDILDGFVARRTKTVSDLGKLLDPVCDVSAHFLCIYALQQVRLAPPIVVVIFILREVWMQLLRTQLVKQNVVLQANVWGKIKTWIFGIAIFVSLLIYPGSYFSNLSFYVRPVLYQIYYFAALVSVFSAAQYLYGGIKHFRTKNNREQA